MAPEDIISSHVVHSKVECSLWCLQKSTCVAYNYRPNSNKYAINCQLSNKTEQIESRGSGEWTLYQNVKTVSIYYFIPSIYNYINHSHKLKIFTKIIFFASNEWMYVLTKKNNAGITIILIEYIVGHYWQIYFLITIYSTVFILFTIIYYHYNLRSFLR